MDNDFQHFSSLFPMVANDCMNAIILSTKTRKLVSWGVMRKRENYAIKVRIYIDTSM